jgi:HEAT repeat protein
VRLLAFRESREDARSGIIALGEAALEPLASALEDTSLPIAVRRHLPRTIARFGSREALHILMERFAVEPDETVGQSLVRALDRMRADDPTLPVDRRALLGEARRSMERAVNLLSLRVIAQRAMLELPDANTPATEILAALLSDKEAGALERVFRILKVIDPLEDFESLFSGLRSRDRRLRETGRELVTHVVADPLRSGILAMLGDGSPEARLRDAVRFHDPPFRARVDRAIGKLSVLDSVQRNEGQREFETIYVESLRAMLLDPSDAVRGVASYCIAELGLDELATELRSAHVGGDGALAELTEEAMGLFDRQHEEVVRAG